MLLADLYACRKNVYCESGELAHEKDKTSTKPSGGERSTFLHVTQLQLDRAIKNNCVIMELRNYNQRLPDCESACGADINIGPVAPGSFVTISVNTP